MLLAHLSDAHIGPLPAPRLRELLGKRVTGWVNWRRGRRLAHDMDALAAVCADIDAHAPDHVAFTGDVVNIGLPAEFPAARAFLERLGPPERVSFTPGNHDVYVRSSLRPLFDSLAPWMTGDDGVAPAPGRGFPYVRRRGAVALVGLCSGAPTMPFLASGRLGRAQIAATRRLLAQLREEGLTRVIMIHHPPHPGGARPGRGLTDAAAFARMIAGVGAELVLHGHNHVASLARLPGPDGPVPVLGAPSASARPGSGGPRAGYHLIRIAPAGGGRPRITVETRGFGPQDEGVTTLARLTPAE